jgi:hypothetical protein
VRHELARLRASAREALGSLAEQIEDRLEDARLLRRLIARRCVYGVDLNPVAVHLARLSVWIHTFVPGLPLSLLDHNLVPGNSLVGIARLAEIEEKAREDDLPLYPIDARRLVGEATEPLQRLALIADATAAEVRRARKAMEEAQEATRPAEALCDIVTACRMTGEKLPIDLEAWDEVKGRIVGSPEHQAARAAQAHLPAFHFPVAFPEVFLRDPPGFDVIIGNPPWEKARVEEHEFWGRQSPGLRGLGTAQRDEVMAWLRQDRPDLVAVWEKEKAESETLRNAVRNLPGMNTGHPDLFRAFLWRFLQLIQLEAGRLGVVLPGDTFRIAGAAELREQLAVVSGTVEIQMLTNKGEWVFDDVDPRKLIALVSASARGHAADVTYRVPPEFHNRKAWDARNPDDRATFSLAFLREYSPSLVTPLLPVSHSFHVLRELMHHPRLLGHPTLRVRRVYADFETSKRDKAYWHVERANSDWPVYKGESFDIWMPDTGSYYAYTNGSAIMDAAPAKRQRAPRGTPYAETPESWRQRAITHPIRSPRIAFRDVTNRTNSRTLVVALIPPNVVTVQTAPWVLWLDPEHPRRQEAYLLGVMSSLVLDWWCRRFVEGHMDQEAFNCLRVPDPAEQPGFASRAMDLVGRLAAPDERFAAWAEAVGVAWGPLPDAQRQDHIHELDAVVAHLYGLREKHLAHIFETFHKGWDYAGRLEATLKHFRAWQKGG